MHQIIVEVDKKGNATVKAEGFQGPSCSLKTAPFIKALGSARTEDKTPEFYQTNTQEQEVQQ